MNKVELDAPTMRLGSANVTVEPGSTVLIIEEDGYVKFAPPQYPSLGALKTPTKDEICDAILNIIDVCHTMLESINEGGVPVEVPIKDSTSGLLN